MRLLFISNLYPLPWQPGRAPFNARMVAALRAAGHEVDVIVPVNLVERIFSRRVRKGNVNTDARHVHFIVPPRILRHRYDRFAWPFLRGALRRAMRRARPDVILAFWLHPDAAIAQRIGDEFGVPVVPMAGGSDLMVITRDPQRRAAVQRVLRNAPMVLTNGNALRRAAIELGAPGERVVAFRRGVDTSTFFPGPRHDARRTLGIDDEARLLLFVGNLVHVKGPDTLVDALARCSATAPWQVAWIGEGPMRQAIEAMAQSAGLASRMRFVGRVAPAALATWYRAADLTALPSRSEGIPNVLLESMACGTPFIAFDVGGIREIAPEPAALIPAGDVAAFASALAAAWHGTPRLEMINASEESMAAQIIGALSAVVGREP